MPISGIVVTCREESSDGVVRQVSQVEGVEVHGVLPGGKIVAVVEAESVEGEVAAVEGLQEIDGVISVQLAYHNFEELDPM